MAAVAMVIAIPGVGLAFADPPTALPGSAPTEDQTFEPAFDYDKDGCYPTPAIGPDGTINPGLDKGGADNGSCRDAPDLDNTNAYSRSKCNNDWCAYMYTVYFEKDQAAQGGGSAGHTHDWEHVVVWVNGGAPQFVSTSAHGNYETSDRTKVLFDGTHAKVIYHKDGQSTHSFRIANASDDQIENHKGAWQLPPVVGWDNYPEGLRDKLTSHDFGSATMGVKDGVFVEELKKAKPGDIPFNPEG